MTYYAFSLIGNAFKHCVVWFEQILQRLGAGSYIVAGIIMLLSMSLLIKPLRGGGSSFAGFTISSINKSKPKKGG